MRGKIIKTENRKELTLKRNFLKRNYVLSLKKSLCNGCGLCATICPKEAINVTRDWVFHSDIKAAAWLTALKKFTSFETVMKELRVKCGSKRISLVEKRNIPTITEAEVPMNAEAIAILPLLGEYESSLKTKAKSNLSNR